MRGDDLYKLFVRRLARHPFHCATRQCTHTSCGRGEAFRYCGQELFNEDDEAEGAWDWLAEKLK